MTDAAHELAPSRPRVLLVEDDRTLCEHLAEALSDEFLMDTAQNGTQALKRVMHATPDVIVTDVVMPDMDGIELLKTLRGTPTTHVIPVLLISGRAPDELRIEGFEQGADGYLAKPYTERELRARIRAMVQIARQRAAATRREALAQAEREAMAERAALLESITDAFYALDRQFRFTYANQLALDYFGKSREEILGQSLWDVVPEAKGSEFEMQFAVAIRGRRSAEFEVLSPFSQRWVDVHIYPTPRGLAVHFRDITGRKQVEQALRESEAALRRTEDRYRAFVANSSEGIWRYELTEPLDPALPVDVQLEHLYRHACLAEANDAMARLHSYDRAEDLIGRTLEQILPRDHPAAQTYLRQIIGSGYRLNNAQSAERDRKGRQHYFNHSMVPVFENGKLVRAWGIQRDVTSDALRTRLGDALRPLTDPADIEAAATRVLGEHLDALRVLYVEITPDGEYGIVRANYLSEATGVVARHRLDDFGPVLMRDFRAGQTVIVENVMCDARLDESARSQTAGLGVGAHLFLPLNRSGRPVAAFAIHYAAPRSWLTDEIALIQELAERTWLVLERARREHEVREANRRKDEFLATLAHELRNPLAPMRSAAQLLKMPNIPDPQARRARDIIERQIHHMVHLIDDLMDASRITLGKINLRQEKVNLGAVISDALEASRPSIEAAAHRLEVHLPPAPLYVQGDSTRLSQVFQNLLNNAAKYTPKGGQLRLSVHSSGGEVSVSVRDNGFGIAKDVQGRIFDLFTRIEPSDHIKVTGLGIGLALARQLIELHHGRIDLKSEGPGQGSEFTVTLPLTEPDAPPEAVTSPHAAVPSEAKSRRVLVVDDNRDAAESLAMLLRASECEVSVAFGGEEALDLFDELKPEIVLLDIGMPGMDGFEVARRIRSSAQGRAALLVALTGWGQVEDKQRSAEAGFDEHVTKPADPVRLHELVTMERSKGD
jgi:PAS domain S-box-containing protein